MQRAKQASKDEQEELPISDTESEKEVVVKKKRGRKPLLKTELTKKPATNEENKMVCWHALQIAFVVFLLTVIF